MNKLFLLALTLLLTPFFSHANIFADGGSVPTKSPDITTQTECLHIGGSLLGYSDGTTFDSCKSIFVSFLRDGDYKTITNSELFCEEVSETWSGNLYTIEYKKRPYKGSTCNSYGSSSNRFKIGSTNLSKTCPPESNPSHTYPITDNSGDIKSCANPDEIPLYDSCDINDSPNVQVTSDNACYTKSDGSKCSVSAVDVGGGNQVYMGNEGNCYADPQPDVTDSPPQGEPNPDGTCSNNGGLLACPEDPANVCGQSGSNYGGGSVNNCQSGCGYVNDSFMCYDTDIDSDGLPDYNDPDVDGDGIPNDSDLDSDGDGKDDPINSGNGNQQGSGGGSVSVDLTPVVSKLDDIKKSMSETKVEIKKKPTPDLVGFWESEYEEGLSGVMEEKIVEVKTTEFFTFIDQFNPSLSGGASPSHDMCFNLGRMGNFGCHNFNVDPRVIPAIRIFILVCAGFLCRKILFGG